MAPSDRLYQLGIWGRTRNCLESTRCAFNSETQEAGNRSVDSRERDPGWSVCREEFLLWYHCLSSRNERGCYCLLILYYVSYGWRYKIKLSHAWGYLRRGFDSPPECSHVLKDTGICFPVVYNMCRVVLYTSYLMRRYLRDAFTLWETTLDGFHSGTRPTGKASELRTDKTNRGPLMAVVLLYHLCVCTFENPPPPEPTVYIVGISQFQQTQDCLRCVFTAVKRTQVSRGFNLHPARGMSQHTHI